MPGRGSYGPGGKWIHDRAEHILRKNEDMDAGSQADKSRAYAIATQQAHKLGKTPKRGAGPRGMYGTPQGKEDARAKYDKPKGEYVKTPAPKSKTASQLVGSFLRIRGLKKMAGLPVPDPETGLDISRPSTTIGKPKTYAKSNMASTPTMRGIDAGPKSVPPPKV